MNFVEAMTTAQSGFDTWAAKPHNKKWAKMVYHTPIPNDLLVNIAEAFCAASRDTGIETPSRDLKISREDADTIRRMMEEFFHRKELSPEETTALLNLCNAGGFGRPVPKTG